MLAVCLSSGAVRADEALAKSKNCMACHALDTKRTGPSYKDIAKRYAGQKNIEAGLAAGCRCVLVRTGNGAGCEDAVRALGVDTVYDDLWTAMLVLREDSSCC